MRFTTFLTFALFFMLGCQSENEKNLLPSGYEYTMHVDAEGDVLENGMTAYFHYQLRNQDSVINSTFKMPVPVAIEIPDTSNLGRPISPFEEALMVMSIGDSLSFTIPLDSFPQRPRGFEDAEFMYCDMVLLDAADKATLEGRANEIGSFVSGVALRYSDGSLEDVQETENGLKYVVHEMGQGAVADTNDMVFANYYGTLSDGTRFDDSFSRGQPFNFAVGMGQVIQGWDEGFLILPEGSKATLFVPSNLGYGETGAPPLIPGGAELIFYVEVISVVENPNM